MRWLLLVALAGCVTQPAPLAPGDEEVRYTHDGIERRFIVHVPDHEGPMPLLVLLHGSQGDAATIRQQSGIDAWADRLGIIVAYPEGTPFERGKPGLAWNALHCCGAPFGKVDDVGFLSDVIDRIDRRGDITSVHVAGRSGGAMMAYHLAIEDPRITTVSAVAGAIGGRPDPQADVIRPGMPEHPVSALIIHAMDDPNVPPAGGRGPKTLGSHSHLPLQDAIDHWVAANNATLETTSTASDGTITETYEGRNATEVIVVRTQGGHGWPGGVKVGASVPPTAPDASEMIARFILSH